MKHTPRTPLGQRELPRYTRGEEIFNMVSHIVGGGLAIAALVLCVVFAAMNGNVMGVVSGAIYGGTMILLYTMSSIYHGLVPYKTPMAKRVFQVIDHCSIFLLIAGTYTPIALVSIREINPGLAWTIFGVIWGAALLGITLNAIDLKKFRIFSLISYIAMGWCVVGAIVPLIQCMSVLQLCLLFGGGIAYTAGSVLYVIGKKKKYMHSIFHIFVIIGSMLHFWCILIIMLRKI